MKKFTCFLISLIACVCFATFAVGCSCGNKTFTVTLDANGGNVDITTVSVTIGSEYNLPTPTKAGYEFSGWELDGSIYELSGTWENKGDVTLVAKWEGKTYQVTLNGNGATLDETYLNVKYGEAFTLPTPTRTGYTFGGWKYNDTVIVNGNWAIDDLGCVLVAEWAPISSKITFNADGGVLVGLTTATINYGDTYTFPEAQKRHATLKGWAIEGTDYLFSGEDVWDCPEAEVTLKAQWLYDIHTITIDANGATSYEGSLTFTKECYTVLDLTTLKIKKEGYAFAGWKVGETTLEGNSYTVTDDVTITATWVPLTTKVAFDTRGGSAITETKDFVYGAAYDISAYQPTKDGYTFYKWSYKDDEGVRRYLDDLSGDAWSVSLANVTLQALWHNESKKTAVTFESDVITGFSYTYYETDFVTLPAIQVEGYNFKGWKIKGTETMMPTTEFEWDKLDASLTLVSVYEKKTYTVTLNANGAKFGDGSTTTTATITYKDIIDFSAKGLTYSDQYVFAGWQYETLDGTRRIQNFDVWMFDSNMIFTAVWVDLTTGGYGPNV